MLTKLKRQSIEGFTIIEVLIVLAIAGLILLIVFLAVPALERNARNTQRVNDVANILSGVTQYEDDNNGDTPYSASISTTGGQLTFSPQAAGGGDSAVNVNNVGYYKGSDIILTGTGTANTTILPDMSATSPVPTDTVYIEFGAECNGNSATTTGASQRSVAALYGIEQGGGGFLQQCKSS